MHLEMLSRHINSERADIKAGQAVGDLAKDEGKLGVGDIIEDGLGVGTEDHCGAPPAHVDLSRTCSRNSLNGNQF